MGFRISSRFVWSDGHVIEEYVDGSIDRNYVHGNQFIDELILFDDNSDVHYYLQDFRYSVYALVNDRGTIEERYRFDPYGKRTVVTDDGSIDEHYGFTGRYHDDSDDTDLIYFRNRWLSPEMGRFVSRDPLDYPDGLNFYAGWFVGLFMDPSGLGTISAEIHVIHIPTKIRVYDNFHYYQDDLALQFVGMIPKTLKQEGGGKLVGEASPNSTVNYVAVGRKGFFAYGATVQVQGFRTTSGNVKFYSDKEVCKPCIKWKVDIITKIKYELGRAPFDYYNTIRAVTKRDIVSHLKGGDCKGKKVDSGRAKLKYNTCTVGEDLFKKRIKRKSWGYAKIKFDLYEEEKKEK